MDIRKMMSCRYTKPSALNRAHYCLDNGKPFPLTLRPIIRKALYPIKSTQADSIFMEALKHV